MLRAMNVRSCVMGGLNGSPSQEGAARDANRRLWTVGWGRWTSGLWLAGLLALLVGCASRPGPPVVASGGELLVVQMCDPQFGMTDYASDRARFEKAVDQVNAIKPDLVFICGDLVHDASARTFADFQSIKSRFRVPCYCAPGNHDVGNEPTAQSLALYRRIVGKDYYVAERGVFAFIVVNTQLWKTSVPGETAAQDAWFQTTLAAEAAQGRRLFVVGHVPIFSKTPEEADGHDNLPLAKRRELLALCRRYGVQAYLAGHSHRTRQTDYFGMQIVQSATTSLNVDFHPFGFRVWHLGSERPYPNEFVRLRLSGQPAPAF